MLVCWGAAVCVFVCTRMLRIVSGDKILRFKNTVIIIKTPTDFLTFPCGQSMTWQTRRNCSDWWRRSSRCVWRRRSFWP